MRAVPIVNSKLLFFMKKIKVLVLEKKQYHE